MRGYFVAAASAAAALALAAPASATAVIGAPIIVATTGDVIATFVGSDAGYESQLDLVGGPTNIFDNKTTAPATTVNLGTFAAGTVLEFSLHVITTGNYFYSGSAALNPDHIAHAAVDAGVGGTSVGFEDVFGGGDKDYNDLNFSFTNTTSAVPEPSSWAMLIGGFGLLGGIARRRYHASEERLSARNRGLATS